MIEFDKDLSKNFAFVITQKFFIHFSFWKEMLIHQGEKTFDRHSYFS